MKIAAIATAEHRCIRGEEVQNKRLQRKKKKKKKKKKLKRRRISSGEKEAKGRRYIDGEQKG